MKDNEDLITIKMVTGTSDWDDTYYEEQALTFTQEELDNLPF